MATNKVDEEIRLWDEWGSIITLSSASFRGGAGVEIALPAGESGVVLSLSELREALLEVDRSVSEVGNEPIKGF